jgi:rhodanese-related sulfurtransferase
LQRVGSSVIVDDMIRTLDPVQASALISEGRLDVVDVRGPREWSDGHIPNARLVPIEALKADLRSALPRDGVVFVCARGVRSLIAAKLAEAAGWRELYSVDGGTVGWAGAGLPLVQG